MGVVEGRMETEVRKGTKDRILDAAQRLFAAHGLEGTSLRAVTAEAGVNLASVNYHFGSKEELFRQVMGRARGPVVEEHRRRLGEMEGRDPSVEELLEAFVAPFARLISDQEDDSLARLVARVMTDPGGQARLSIIEQTQESDAMFLKAFSRALPHLPLQELVWRFYAVLGAIMFQLIGASARKSVGGAVPFEMPATGAEGLTARMVPFLAAGLRAPASTEDPERPKPPTAK